MVDLKELRNEIQSIIGAITIKDAFLGLMLKRTWIVASSEIQNAPAWTDGLKIYVNPSLFAQYDSDVKKYILLHELMHIILKHVPRAQRLFEKYSPSIQDLVNIVGDAKVNQYLDEAHIWIPSNVVTIRMVSDAFELDFTFVEKASMEEIVEEILKKYGVDIKISVKAQWSDVAVDNVSRASGGATHAEGSRPSESPQEGSQSQADNREDKSTDSRGEDRGSGGATGSEDQKESGKGRGRGRAHSKKKRSTEGSASASPQKGSQSGEASTGGRIEGVLNEGDERDRETIGRDSVERAVEKKVAEAYMVAKSIGRTPGYLERLVKEILKPTVDWRSMLRAAVTKTLGSSIWRTWHRTSRKCDSFPAKERYGLRKVVVLMDTSGSIGEKELQQFLGEIYGIARERARIVVVPWDATVYEESIIRSPGDVERIKIHGGGGTRILPALQHLDSHHRDADAVIIMSDWWIDDIHNKEVETILRKYADRLIAVTTSRDPPNYLRNVIKLKF